MPNILNVTVVSFLFFIIFGTIGVSSFRGEFWHCEGFDKFDPILQLIITSKDCMNYGGLWKNTDYHFDNISAAILTLFEMATTEGWVKVMNSGIDATGIGLQPIERNNLWKSIFFIIFIVVGSFFIINLFVGVVIQTFKKQKEVIVKDYLLTETQREWIATRKMMIQYKPLERIDRSNMNFIRKKMLRIA